MLCVRRTYSWGWFNSLIHYITVFVVNTTVHAALRHHSRNMYWGHFSKISPLFRLGNCGFGKIILAGKLIFVSCLCFSFLIFKLNLLKVLFCRKKARKGLHEEVKQMFLKLRAWIRLQCIKKEVRILFLSFIYTAVCVFILLNCL